MTEEDVDLTEIDNETMLEHQLLAWLDGRVEHYRILGEELVRRGFCSQADLDKALRNMRRRKPLSRPIIAGPDD